MNYGALFRELSQRKLVHAARQDLSAAAAGFAQLTRRYPDDKNAWLWLARAYARDPARRAEREHALRQALKLDPTFAPAARELARALAERGDAAGADSFATYGTETWPRQPGLVPPRAGAGGTPATPAAR